MRASNDKVSSAAASTWVYRSQGPLIYTRSIHIGIRPGHAYGQARRLQGINGTNPAMTSVTPVGTLADLILYAPTRTALIAVWRRTCVPAAVASGDDTTPMTP